MKFKKGESGNPEGRPKGALNKETKSFKEAFDYAFDSIGGPEALAKWAKKNPDDFYKIIGKRLPQEIRIQEEEDTGGLSKQELLNKLFGDMNWDELNYCKEGIKLREKELQKNGIQAVK